jgi:hypothetical protein
VPRCVPLLLATAAAAACLAVDRAAEVPESAARPFTEAEVMFHRDPRWLGADGALSVLLAKNRVLWLFGDTFVATSNAHVRSRSTIVKNSVALQTGTDPRTAAIDFRWGVDRNGSPRSFFPEHGKRCYWPGHGVRVERGPLVVFLDAEMATPGRGLGFSNTGYGLAIVDDPDSALEHWIPRVVDGPRDPFDAVAATAVLQEGSYVVAVAIRQTTAEPARRPR